MAGRSQGARAPGNGTCRCVTDRSDGGSPVPVPGLAAGSDFQVVGDARYLPPIPCAGRSVDPEAERNGDSGL